MIKSITHKYEEAEGIWCQMSLSGHGRMGKCILFGCMAWVDTSTEEVKQGRCGMVPTHITVDNGVSVKVLEYSKGDIPVMSHPYMFGENKARIREVMSKLFDGTMPVMLEAGITIDIIKKDEVVVNGGQGKGDLHS